MLRWRLSGSHVPWPALPPNPSYAPPPSTVAPGTAAVTFIGHATFLLQVAGVTILTDPVFSDRCSPVGWAGPRRARPPGLALTRLPPIDLVLVSHSHYDHLDMPSLRRLAGRGTPEAVTMLGNAPLLRQAGFGRVSAMDWWESRAAGPIRITATPARHASRRGPGDTNRSLWGGFCLETNEGSILFAGDSGAGPHWAAIRTRLGPPGLALLPIGAYEPRSLMAPVHMNPAEAVQAHRDLEARHSVGMHFGTFQLTDEPVDEPERLLREAGIPEFTTLGFGETRVFDLRP